MTKHTPGPWEIIGGNVYSRETKPGRAAHVSALICRNPTDDDANLIAAAPELLTALEALAQRYRGSVALNDEHAALAEQAFAAIAKAKGTAR